MDPVIFNLLDGKILKSYHGYSSYVTVEGEGRCKGWVEIENGRLIVPLPLSYA